jgi:hypothetical protein
VRKPPRTFTFCALLMLLVAGLWAGHALSRVADRARSLPARWRRSETRYAIPPHPRPYIPGIGHLDVVPVPFPDSMPRRPADASATTLVDGLPLVRPYVAGKHVRPGRWAA